MLDARFFIGQPIPFGNICKVYPPSVGEIVESSNSIIYASLLTQSQEDLEDLVLKRKLVLPEGQSVPSPFQFLLDSSAAAPQKQEQVRNAFKFFLHEDVIILYEQKMIVIGDIQTLTKITDINQLRFLSSENFFAFQNLVRQSMGYEEIEPIPVDDDPAVARMKMMGRRRDRLAKKSKENKKGVSFSVNLAAICCMFPGITPLNIGEISYASVTLLSKMYQQKEKYDFEMQCISAGADPKKIRIQYWIREQTDYNEVRI